jgi:hypothetical protein
LAIVVLLGRVRHGDGARHGFSTWPGGSGLDAPARVVDELRLAGLGGADAGVEDGGRVEVDRQVERGVDRLARLEVVEQLAGEVAAAVGQRVGLDLLARLAAPARDPDPLPVRRPLDDDGARVAEDDRATRPG